jgi:hypothetical protein
LSQRIYSRALLSGFALFVLELCSGVVSGLAAYISADGSLRGWLHSVATRNGTGPQHSFCVLLAPFDRGLLTSPKVNDSSPERCTRRGSGVLSGRSLCAACGLAWTVGGAQCAGCGSRIGAVPFLSWEYEGGCESRVAVPGSFEGSERLRFVLSCLDDWRSAMRGEP